MNSGAKVDAGFVESKPTQGEPAGQESQSDKDSAFSLNEYYPAGHPDSTEDPAGQ